MNNYYRYRNKDNWITVRKEENLYYIVNPINLSLITINEVQAAILYFLKVERMSLDELKAKLCVHGILGVAIDEFINNAKYNNLL